MPGPLLFTEYTNSIAESVFEVVKYLQFILLHLEFEVGEGHLRRPGAGPMMGDPNISKVTTEVMVCEW